MNIRTVIASVQQNDERDQLTQNGGKRGARDAHFKAENKQRVQPDIDDRAADKPCHGIHRAPFKTELVIDDKLRAHKRRAEQNDAQVIFRIFENGRCRAEDSAERIQKKESENHQNRAQYKGQREAGCRSLIRLPGITGAKASRHEIA